jgi:mannosyltransferase OCH1-like enzyme
MAPLSALRRCNKSAFASLLPLLLLISLSLEPPLLGFLWDRPCLTFGFLGRSGLHDVSNYRRHIFVGASITSSAWYDLPVLPASVIPHYDPTVEIPRTVWMTTKFPDEAKRRMNIFFSLNKEYNIHIVGDEEMDVFMAGHFANTSVLWAYQNINPTLMAAKADIWRLATLWVNGGTYMDADSHLATPINQIIKNEDRFIFGSEKNMYGDCYAPSYRLNKTDSHQFAEGRIVVNWLLMSSPKHPFLSEALYDVVDAIRQQYLKQHYLYEKVRPAFFQIICSTGPGLLTAAMSEVITNRTSFEPVKAGMSGAGNNLKYRYVGEDWKSYGGSWKAPRSAGGVGQYSKNGHYSDVMEKGGQLLATYVN